MTVAAPNSLTLLEFLALPGVKPANEYINGSFFPKPMPQGKNSLIQRELSFVLTAAFRVNKITQVFPELRCTFGDRFIVPDLAVFRQERIPRDENGEIANSFNLAPDWTIEIFSPNQSQTRVIRNILYCLEYGTEIGWLIDPDEPCLFAYDGDRRVREFFELDVTLPVPPFAKGITLSLGKILD